MSDSASAAGAVTLSAGAGRVLGEEMRRMPEFIDLRERIAGAIEQ